MKLAKYQEQREQFEQQGFVLPQYDRAAVIAKTSAAPAWVHFGAGNIFRAFAAHLQQILLNQGLTDTGIIVAEGFDEQIVEKAYRPYDELSMYCMLKADGSVVSEVIGSVTESLIARPDTEDWARLIEIFKAPSLQMASCTITEKGYASSAPGTLMDGITQLLYARFQAGKAPLALVSMDNCSHNGEKFQNAVCAACERGIAEGTYTADFATYITEKVSFPWSMIDKITPRPDQTVVAMLEEAGFEDTEIIVTDKHTWTAPFVNAEQAEYLVIEDSFPNGRPALEHAGVIFTDREHVNMTERMKVCTCLNPLHTALAIFGCLLGQKKICDEMQDEDLKAMVYKLGYEEGMPVVTDPEIMDPKQFIKDVLELRLPNPFMPDTPQRIATDTSQKLSIRFGETIKSYLASDALDVQDLKIIPMVLAGWLRYLSGVGDDGQPFEISPDPLLAEVQNKPAEEILKDTTIFGVDLEKAGLAEKILASYARMNEGPGAVRAEIRRNLA